MKRRYHSKTSSVSWVAYRKSRSTGRLLCVFLKKRYLEQIRESSLVALSSSIQFLYPEQQLSQILRTSCLSLSSAVPPRLSAFACCRQQKLTSRSRCSLSSSLFRTLSRQISISWSWEEVGKYQSGQSLIWPLRTLHLCFSFILGRRLRWLNCWQILEVLGEFWSQCLTSCYDWTSVRVGSLLRSSNKQLRRKDATSV